MKKIILSLALIILSSALFAQASAEKVFHFNKVNGKIFQPMPNGQKACSFEVSGISSQNEANQLVANFKNKKGIADFNLTDAQANGNRKGKVVLAADAKPVAMKDAMMQNNILKITIDGQNKSTRELVPAGKKANK